MLINIPKEKPDFSGAYIKANEILVNSHIIPTFPYTAKALVKEQTPMICRTYKKALKYGIDINIFGSESAIIFNYQGINMIFYNEKKNREHIEFSILHEMGHFLLGHSLKKISDETYSRYEVESNYFAAQLLMPEQIIREFQRRGAAITIPFLVKSFGVSKPAAEKRLKTLSIIKDEWRKKSEKEYDDIILWKYEEFINSIIPKQSYDFEDELYFQSQRETWY